MDKKIEISKEHFKKSNYKSFIIVGDVGGTNTYIAIMGVKNNKSFDAIFKNIYSTKSIKGFENLLNDTLREAKEQYDIEVNTACIGAAGPVSRKRGYVKLTNAPLEISTSELLAKTMLEKIILVNDFEIIGYGLDILDAKKDVIKLHHTGKDLTSGWVQTNTFAAIGAGTGLGMSIAPYNLDKQLHMPLPSEGGHIDFAPQSELEAELVDFLRKNQKERISGV